MAGVRISYIVVGILAAGCALGQPVTVGYLLESGELAAAGRYDNGKWTMPSAKTTPKEWTLWGAEFHGSKVHLTAPEDPRAAEQPGPPGYYYGFGWMTDFPKRTDDMAWHAKSIGVVTSAPVRVVLFKDRTENASEQKKVDAFLGPLIRSHRDSWIAKKQLHPTKVAVDGPVWIERSESDVDGRVYYHVQHLTQIYDPQNCPQCPEDYHYLVLFDAWFTESAGGRSLVSAHSQFDDEYQKQLEHVDPVSIVVPGGTPYAITREQAYESESAVILDLSRKSVRVLPRNLWFSL